MDEQAPDAALATAAAFGNVHAFSELARRYRRAALRIAAAVTGPDSAEDIVQDALLIAFRSIADLDDPECFAAWFAAITRNRALRVARKEGRITRVGLDESIEVHLKEIAEMDRRRQAVAHGLFDEIELLPADLRLIMRLRWLDEMSLNQISAFTGLPVSTIKWRLHQGRKHLQKTKGIINGTTHRTVDSETCHDLAAHGPHGETQPMDGDERSSGPVQPRSVQPHSGTIKSRG